MKNHQTKCKARQTLQTQEAAAVLEMVFTSTHTKDKKIEETEQSQKTLESFSSSSSTAPTNVATQPDSSESLSPISTHDPGNKTGNDDNDNYNDSAASNDSITSKDIGTASTTSNRKRRNTDISTPAAKQVCVRR
jgi:hypothetical protein